MKKLFLFISTVFVMMNAGAQVQDSLCCKDLPLKDRFFDLETALTMKETVNILDLSMQSPKLTTVPAEVSRLHALKCLDLCFNRINAIPESFKNLTNLVCLNVSGNRYLPTLPAFLNELPNLKVIMAQDMNWSAAKKQEMKDRFPNIILVLE
jgi:Leucine-rich repeat (LRR) protein